MKSLKRYIYEEYNKLLNVNEEYEEFKLKNLHVEYDVFNVNNKSILTFHVPDSYSESDFQIYMQDMLLPDLPAGENFAEEKFGDNTNYISDVFFQYEKFEKSDKEQDCVEWDSKLDDGNHDPEKEDFTYVTITNIKYIIEFDEFKIKEDSRIDVRSTVDNIFKTFESSPENEYSVNIVFDEKKITYKD